MTTPSVFCCVAVRYGQKKHNSRSNEDTRGTWGPCCAHCNVFERMASPMESSVYHGVPSLMEQSLAWRPLSWRPFSHGVLSLMESSLSWNPLSHVAISLMRVISLMESSLSWGPILSSYGDPLSHAIIMHTGEICYKPKEATI